MNKKYRKCKEEQNKNWEYHDKRQAGKGVNQWGKVLEVMFQHF